MLFEKAFGRLTASQQENFRKWQRRARRYPSRGSLAGDGRQVVKNLTQERQLGRDQNPAEEIFRRFLERLSSLPERADVKDSYEEACKGFILKGPGISGQPPPLVSRFVTAETFLTKSLPRKAQRKLGLNIGASSNPPDFRLTLKAFLDGWRENPIKVRAELRKARLGNRKNENVFLTFNVSEEYRRSPAGLFRRIGKEPSQPPRSPILELKVPVAELREKRYPTVCDAGWNGCFLPSKRRDAFGRTLDLNQNPPSRGVPEFVAENRTADCVNDFDTVPQVSA